MVVSPGKVLTNKKSTAIKSFIVLILFRNDFDGERRLTRGALPAVLITVINICRPHFITVYENKNKMFDFHTQASSQILTVYTLS